MPIEIDKRIDLTEYEGNSPPLIVEQLSIVHEATDGEIVQYFLVAGNHTERDKASHAIGVYDRETDTWSYYDYDELEWASSGQRITGAQVERLGVKAFPGMGAFAFYKLMHRKITRIVIPVNRKKSDNEPPTLDATVNADGSVTFRIEPPERPEYECYRIVMQSGIYMEEHITYETELTVPKPRISGEYYCYAVGYAEEGQVYSRDSKVITLTLTGRSERFTPPYYTKAEIVSMTDMKTLTFTGGENKAYNGKADVSVAIPVIKALYGTEEPDAETGIDGSVYIQYAVEDGMPVITAEWVKLEGKWIARRSEIDGN